MSGLETFNMGCRIAQTSAERKNACGVYNG